MENAVKALLIAAAVLISVMLLSMVFIFWEDIASYFTERNNAKILEQLVEFNNRFENYNGQTIRGNELVSIMNRIIDYNNYQSGIENYERVVIEIDLLGHQNELQDENVSGVQNLFPSRYIKNTDDDESIKEISELSANLLSGAKVNLPWLTETKLQKLSSNISWIAYDNISNYKEKQDYEANRLTKLKEILGREVQESEIEDIKEATCLYNQFTLFKRAMFKCTEVSHNLENGRVNGMQFEVVLEEDINGNETIKFD